MNKKLIIATVLAMFIAIGQVFAGDSKNDCICHKTSGCKEKKEKCKCCEMCSKEKTKNNATCNSCDKVPEKIECNDDNVLYYDAKVKTFYFKGKRVENLKQLDKIKYGQEFKVKIFNINRYIYNVGISADDVLFNSEPPTLFKQLFMGDGDYLNGIIENLGKSNIISDNEFQKNFVENLKSFYNNIYSIMDGQVNVYNKCMNEAVCCNEKHINYEQFSQLANSLLELKVSYQTFNRLLSDEISDSKKEIGDYKCNQSITDLEEKIKNEKDINKKKLIEQELGKCKLVNEIKELENQKSELEKFWNSVSKITDEDLMKLVMFDNNLVKENFSYITPPIFPKGNELKINISITPSDSSLVNKWNTYPLERDSTFNISFLIKNKWFVSFSTGAFVGFGNGLRDESFNWQKQADSNNVIQDTSLNKLVATGWGSQPLGISAFANIGMKINPNFGFAISPGVGIRIEDKVRPIYFIGGTLMFGGKSQFNLTGGMALTQVKRLKSEMYPNIGNTLFATTPEVQFSQQLKTGFFLSVSYTLFSNVNNNIFKSNTKK